ncbi:MAG: hypothetical protein ACRDQ0_08110 [Pseudonocardia sp.]
MKERVTISVDGPVAARVRQCGARTRGGASAYVERLVRQDAMREAATSAAAWYAAHPGYADDSVTEAESSLAETA